MRRCPAAVLLAALLAFAAAAQDKDGKPKDKPAPSPGAVPGKDLPATFNPYNVTASFVAAPEPEKIDDKTKAAPPKTRGKFHSLISEYDLDPVVMIVARSTALDEAAGLRDLLQKVNGTIERNRAVRLRGFVTFLLEDVTDKEGKTLKADVVAMDRQRGEAAARLEKMADDLKLAGLVVALAAPKDLAAFKLDDKAALNVVLYRRLKVEAVHNLERDKLDKPGSTEAEAILKDVAAKLKAVK